MENNKDEKTLKYSGISFMQIKNIVKIKKKVNRAKFENWFNFEYKISESDNNFLKKLVTKNELYLPSYNETKLLLRFIGPVLFRVDFNFDDVQDWYESWLRGELNGFKFAGKPDFMVAKGETEPEKPYFFIQEFKRSKQNDDPEFQILAEMLVAMEVNKTNIFHGAFIIGQNWFFVVLEKLKCENYEYFVSEQFDCLKINELKQIYINLQAVKFFIKKEINF